MPCFIYAARIFHADAYAMIFSCRRQRRFIWRDADYCYAFADTPRAADYWLYFYADIFLPLEMRCLRYVPARHNNVTQEMFKIRPTGIAYFLRAPCRFTHADYALMLRKDAY